MQRLWKTDYSLVLAFKKKCGKISMQEYIAMLVLFAKTKLQSVCSADVTNWNAHINTSFMLLKLSIVCITLFLLMMCYEYLWSSIIFVKLCISVCIFWKHIHAMFISVCGMNVIWLYMLPALTKKCCNFYNLFLNLKFTKAKFEFQITYLIFFFYIFTRSYQIGLYIVWPYHALPYC